MNTVRRMRNAKLILISAAALSTVIGSYHLIGGTPEVMQPVYTSELPRESASVLDVLWYHMALLMGCTSAALLVAAFRESWRNPVAWIIGGHFALLSAVCLYLSFAWFGHPWGLAQWVLFLPLALLTFWGGWGRNREA